MRTDPDRTPLGPCFPRFALAQSGSYLAYNMLTVAVGWQAYDLTRSPMVLGLVGLVQFAPQLLLALLAGHAADRYSRQRIAVGCLLAQAVVAVALALGSHGAWLDEAHILACAFLVGAARAFETPTMQAFLPALLTPEALPRGLALGATGRQSGIILGPALGGFLYLAGPEAVYAACAAFYLAAVSLAAAIKAPCAAPRRAPASLRSVFEGLAYIRSKPEILGAISLDMVSVLLGGATALLPIFARDILHTGPWGLGVLRAAPAMGAVAMSLRLARWPLRRKVGRTMFAAVGVFGLATVVFGLSRDFYLSLAALLALGAADNVSVVIRSSLVQLETPDEKRGRVSAVNSVFIGASNQLGEFESGLTAAWFGTVPATVLGGACVLLVVLAWMRLFPALRRRDTLVRGGVSATR